MKNVAQGGCDGAPTPPEQPVFKKAASSDLRADMISIGAIGEIKDGNILFGFTIALSVAAIAMDCFTWSQWNFYFPGSPLGDVAGYSALLALPTLLAAAILSLFLAIAAACLWVASVTIGGWRTRLIISLALCIAALAPPLWFMSI